MRKSSTVLITLALGVAAAGAAGAASAAERMSDSAFLSASRCRGLAEARQLDTSSIEAMLKSQKNGRDNYIGDRAKQVRRDAAQDGRSTDLTRKARIDAELSGVCASYLSVSPT